jgi:hypothetical protein
MENEWPEKAERLRESQRVRGGNASVSNGRGGGGPPVDQFIAHGIVLSS